MKKLFSLFCPKWQVKEAYRGKWEVENYENFTGSFLYMSEDSCVFEIMHSKTRNEWKLVMSGKSPKKHPMYPEVVERLNELSSKS